MDSTNRYAAAIGFILAIVTANYLTDHYGLVGVGFGLEATAGTYAAGTALLLRDYLQDRWGRGATIALIVTACAITYLIAPSLAYASAAAFLVSELVDMAAYTPLRKYGFYRAAIVSNILGAIVDTLLFLHLAGFPVTAEGVTAQLVAKVLWATLVPLAVLRAVKR